MASVRDNLAAMLARGQDTALLRFSLGNLCLQAGESEAAVTHLRQAVTLDPAYSAAWKQLGRALLAADQPAEAAQVWAQGIAVAEGRGDKQAAREMRVFRRRLDKQSDG